MKEQSHVHLQEDQIIWAVIDEKELGTDVLKHLLACPACRGKVEQFKSDLHEFGRRAEQAVPPFSRTIKLPSKKQAAVSHNAGWLPFFGATAMASLVVFFYVMGMGTVYPGKLITGQGQEMFLEDESLMREISEMVEYPLSDDMYEITGENGDALDEDFMQFIIPEMQDDFQS